MAFAGRQAPSLSIAVVVLLLAFSCSTRADDTVAASLGAGWAQLNQNAAATIQKLLGQVSLAKSGTEGLAPVVVETKLEASPEVELGAKLVSAVGVALEKYYGSNAEFNKEISCADAIGNETQSLLTFVAEEVDAICEKGTKFTTFCSFYEDFRNITAIALVSKLEVNPISIALTRAAADGPCSPSHGEDMVLHGHLKKMKKVAKVHWKKVGGHRHLQKLLQEDESNDVKECKSCLKKGFKLFAELLLKKLAFICQKSKCSKIQEACKFAQEHKYLTQVALLLKYKPWEKVVKSCAIIGSCQLASLNSIPSGKDLYLLPNVKPFEFKSVRHLNNGRHHLRNGSWISLPTKTGFWASVRSAVFGNGETKVDLHPGADSIKIARQAGFHGKRKCRHHMKEGKKTGESHWSHAVGGRLTPEGRDDEDASNNQEGAVGRRFAREEGEKEALPLEPRDEPVAMTPLKPWRRVAGYRIHHRGGIWGVHPKEMRSTEGVPAGLKNKVKKLRSRERVYGEGKGQEEEGGKAVEGRQLHAGQRPGHEQGFHGEEEEEHHSHHHSKHEDKEWKKKHSEEAKDKAEGEGEKKEGGNKQDEGVESHLELPRRVLKHWSGKMAEMHHGHDDHHKWHKLRLPGGRKDDEEEEEKEVEGFHGHKKHHHVDHHGEGVHHGRDMLHSDKWATMDESPLKWVGADSEVSDGPISELAVLARAIAKVVEGTESSPEMLTRISEEEAMKAGALQEEVEKAKAAVVSALRSMWGADGKEGTMEQEGDRRPGRAVAGDAE